MINIRKKTALILNDNHISSRLGKIVSGLLFLLIFLNVVVIVLESVNSLEKQYHQFFYVFEIFSVVIFTIEYFARLWSSVDSHQGEKGLTAAKKRLKYIFTPLAIVDLLAILPFYLSMFFLLDLRFLRVLRLLRIFKLTRYSAAMKTLLSVLKDELPALVASYIIMFTIVILASSGIYLLEHQVQPDKFGDIPSSMWWAVVSLTTVGYGDVTPITTAGKFFGGIITLIGISMVALPTGIIASGFGNAFRRKRQKYELMMAKAFSDGELSFKESEVLKQVQNTLGLSNEDAKQIYKEAMQRHFTKIGLNCPNCGAKQDELGNNSEK
jgi:voltage-gated potassium channel